MHSRYSYAAKYSSVRKKGRKGSTNTRSCMQNKTSQDVLHANFSQTEPCQASFADSRESMIFSCTSKSKIPSFRESGPSKLATLERINESLGRRSATWRSAKMAWQPHRNTAIPHALHVTFPPGCAWQEAAEVIGVKKVSEHTR